jgi:hypothetical protein
MDTWYRHRIVKHCPVPGVRFVSNPVVADTLAALKRQAEADMAVYLRNHKPGQKLVTQFVHQEVDGLRVFVAVTLFGPPEMETEILQELVEREEI